MKTNHHKKIAYVSMEIAVDEKLSTYAGGLGVLAGDFLRSAADLDLPLVGVTLLSKRGYLDQKIDRLGQQQEAPEVSYSRKLKRMPQTIKVAVGPDQVRVGVWQYQIKQKLPVYFLDTNYPDNKPEYRHLTDSLYGRDRTYRLKQEIILGRGAVKMLDALGYKIKKYHINEGHGMLAALEIITPWRGETESKQRKKLAKLLVFTNHTIVKAGQDIFPLATMLTYQPDFPTHFDGLIIDGEINLTNLGVALAGKTNGVSRSHGRILRQEFAPAKIGHITNGVHAVSWTSPEFAKLYDQYLPGWRENNQLLKKTKKIPLEEMASAHSLAKHRLLRYVFQKTQTKLDEQAFTIVFARRFTSYKQPLLLLSDIGRLLKINRRWPLQIIYAGKAHAKDIDGKEMIKKIYQLKEKYQKQIKIVFLENYELPLARILVSGADLWLNTPLPPNEACGTSGMKAALNGVPQLSAPDGWWLEAYKKNRNGWLIKRGEAESLYHILEHTILPLYYHDPIKWQKRMRQAIYYNAPKYNSERMAKEYWEKLYC